MSEEEARMLRDEDLKNYNLGNLMALSAIAHEIERFHNTETPHQNLSENEDVLQKLIKTKSMLKTKRNNLHKIKSNLRTACLVAKTVISAKDSETSLLNSHLNVARSECVDLAYTNRKNENLIHSLTEENRALHKRLNIICNFIQLGYQELQKIRNEQSGEISAEIQLKKIIICCGQYYADYCNEKAKSILLGQNKQFLNNRLNILKNKLQTTSEEVKNLKNHKERLQKETALLSNEAHNNLNIVYSEYRMQHQSNPNFSHRTLAKIKPVKSKMNDDVRSKVNDLDLTSHLSMVKHLLNDQETLLNDIKSISQELITLNDVVV